MSGSVNKVILVGHLGRDPEVRSTQSGGKIVSLNVATSESWRDKNSGERQERTQWHRVVIFNETIAKVAEQYLKKGSKVYLEGQVETRKWTDQAGAEKYVTEIVLRPYRGEIVLLDRAERAPAPDEASYGTTKPAGAPASASYAADLDDDIPF